MINLNHIAYFMVKVTRDTNFHVNFAYLFITSNYIIFKRSGEMGGK